MGDVEKVFKERKKDFVADMLNSLDTDDQMFVAQIWHLQNSKEQIPAIDMIRYKKLLDEYNEKIKHL